MSKFFKRCAIVLFIIHSALSIIVVTTMVNNYMTDVSKELIEFVKLKEGFKATAYEDGNHHSIGYGHRVYDDMSYIYTKLSKEQAEYLLKKDLKKFINDLIRVYPKFTKLDQGKRDALTSLVYNWGLYNFMKSKLFTNLKKGDYEATAKEFLDIVKSKGKVMGGLVKRRQKEADIFLHGW